MIDLDWLKVQGAPSWAQHIAKEVHALQAELFGHHEPPAAATVAPTPPAPLAPPVEVADEAGDADSVQLAADESVPGPTGTPLLDDLTSSKGK
ncbi:MAG TPA: hypothetical protein VGG84_10320 [Gemmatimonadaceae bacterium]